MQDIITARVDGSGDLVCIDVKNHRKIKLHVEDARTLYLSILRAVLKINNETEEE